MWIEFPVVPVKKEIACLITIDDLQKLDLSRIEPVVIIPGGHLFMIQKFRMCYQQMVLNARYSEVLKCSLLMLKQAWG